MSFEKRNQNNIIQFPNKENPQVLDQHKQIAAVTISISEKMNNPKIWDICLFTQAELTVLANFGKTIEFSPIVTKRLVANLSNHILKRNQIEEEFLI